MPAQFEFSYIAGPNLEGPDDLTIVSATQRESDPAAYTLKSSELNWLNQVLTNAGLPLVARPTAGLASWVSAFRAMLVGVGKKLDISPFDIAPRDKGRRLAISGQHSPVTHMTLEAAADLWTAAKNSSDAALVRATERLKRLFDYITTRELDFQSAPIFDACARLGVPCHRFGPTPDHFHLGEGRRRQVIWLSDFFSTGLIATGLAGNKAATNQILARNGIPVPRQAVVKSIDQAWETALEFGLPIVVKPTGGNRGRGVSLNVRSREELDTAIEAAAKIGPLVILETFIPGEEYRVIVANGKIIGTVHRKAAAVVGDGKSAVRELIAIYNRTKPFPDSVVGPIPVDKADSELLAAQGHSLETTPSAGEIVQIIRKPGNLTGGLDYAVDLRTIHSDNVAMLARAAAAMGLGPTGIDLRTDDITRSWKDVGAGICEVNTGAGLRPLLIGDLGWVHDHFIPAAIDPQACKIPHIVILSPESQRSSANRFSEQLVDDLQRKTGWQVARSTPSELWLGGYQVSDAEPFPWQRYVNIIECPVIDAAIYVVETDQIRAFGLGVPEIACLVRFGASEAWADTDHETADKISAIARPAATAIVSSSDGQEGAAAVAEIVDIVRSLSDAPSMGADREWVENRGPMPITTTGAADSKKDGDARRVEALTRLVESATARQLDFQSAALVEACETLGVPVHQFEPAPKYFHLGEGRWRQIANLTNVLSTSLMASGFAGHKVVTNKILKQNGVPVPRQVLVGSLEQAWDTAFEIGFPAVVKPSGGGQGKGVNVNVRTREDMEKAIADAAKVGPEVILESYLSGQEYRVVVVGGEVVGMIRRNHPYVSGDGNSTIRDLIVRYNETKPLPDDILVPIRIEDVDPEILARQGHSVDSKPAMGERVQLNNRVGYRAGGVVDNIDPQTIHPDNLDMLIRACSVIGLDPAGIDFRIEDITKSWRDVPAGIVEVNSGAGFNLMLFGDPNWLVDRFLPTVIDPGACKIPHIAVAAAPDESEAAAAYASDLAAELARQRDWEVARSLPSELWLGDYRVREPEDQLQHRYGIIVESPFVDAAIYVVAPEQLGELAEAVSGIDCLVRLAARKDWSEADLSAADQIATVVKPSTIVDAAASDVAEIATGISERWPSRAAQTAISPVGSLNDRAGLQLASAGHRISR